MGKFLETTHLSEILEKSQKQPVIIFKFSSECGTSSDLKDRLEKEVENGRINSPIYLVTVQTHKALSEKIAILFQIQHESPQIIILNKGKVTYTAHHKDIIIKNFKFN